MTTKINSSGMLYGNASVSGATTGVIATAFIKNITALIYLRGGTTSLGGSARPYMSALTTNTNFTLSNLGGTATSANWLYMP